jgi:thiamine-monophosphate kinase
MDSPSLQQLGEDEVVKRLLARLPAPSRSVRIPAGDDCAVVRVPGASRWQLLKTDVVVEGVHFLPGEDLRRVGWKALCRAVSDVAAMGGVPEAALVTILTSSQMPIRRLEALYSGLAKAARRFGVSIVGGETARMEGPLVCNVALTGWVSPKCCVSRSGGKPGDVLFVTGRLGGSLRTGKHLDFVPRLVEAAWLVRHVKVHAMMDLSDGLGLDGERLARASGCQLEWDLESIPRTPGCSVEEAFKDGEDFELLFAIAPTKASALRRAWVKAFPRTPLTPVGRLLQKKVRTRSSPESLRVHGGYDHFQ